MKYVIIILNNLSKIMEMTLLCIFIMSILDGFCVSQKSYVVFALCLLFDCVSDFYLLGGKNKND